MSKARSVTGAMSESGTTDKPTLVLNVRYRVSSGKHLLAASISGFDPEDFVKNLQVKSRGYRSLVANRSLDFARIGRARSTISSDAVRLILK
jgi:hypothetical protein